MNNRAIGVGVAVAAVAGAAYLYFNKESNDIQTVGASDSGAAAGMLSDPNGGLNFNFAAPTFPNQNDNSSPSWGGQAAGTSTKTNSDVINYGFAPANMPIASSATGGVLYADGSGGVVPASFAGSGSTKKAGSSGGSSGLNYTPAPNASYGMPAQNYTPAPNASYGTLSNKKSSATGSGSSIINYTPAQNYTPAPSAPRVDNPNVGKNYTPAKKKTI